jgi:hypothetical protein
MKNIFCCQRLAMVLVVIVFLTALCFAAENNNNNGTLEGKTVSPALEKRATATAGMETKAHKHLEGEFLDWFHNPAPWMEMTLDLRLRHVSARNMDTLDDETNNRRGNKWIYQRYRMRWGQKLKLNPDIDFNSRLIWEMRTWNEPKRKPQSTDFDEILFDRFNFTMRNMFDAPLTGVFGRQDIILGKGWLVLDGTPLDGSRTIFMDAARLTYDMEECDTKVDMIYIDQGATSDRWLKPINDRDRHFTEQDEYGAIVYVTNKSLTDTQVEGYFMYKNDNPVNSSADDFPNAVWSRDAEIFTLGGAVQGDIDKAWDYRVEGAFQTGDRNGRDLRAFGSKADLRYKFCDPKQNSLHVVYEFLSGDDPSTTNRDEQFDPLWGEWPQWSELYVYTYSRETMIGETTNLHRLGFGHSFKPAPKWQLLTDYNLLWADENTRRGAAPAADGFAFSDNGKFRGQLLTMWLKYSCCKQVNAHFLTEYLIPGNYYQHGTRDHAFFIRFNVEYVF